MPQEEDMIVDNGQEPDVTPGDESQPANDDPGAPTPVAEEGILIDNDEPEAADDEAGEAPGDESPAGGSEEGEGEGDAGDEAPSPRAAEARPADTEQAPEPVTDPGAEFTPKGDYAFEIELADGSTVRIEKPEDVDRLPEDVQFKSAAAFMQAQTKLNAMTQGIEAERREWQDAREKYEAQSKAAEETEVRITTMINEMNYLESEGKLPKVDPKYENADWSDPEIQKQPGIKERLDVLNYRAAENVKREKFGLPPMSIIEAQMALERDNEIKAANDRKKAEGQHRRAKGSMVSGPTPTPANNIPDDVIVGEGGSIRDLDPSY